MPYDPTTWVNNQAPALSATNLNHLTDELKAQAAELSIPHTLGTASTWTDGASPALTDATTWNEMERVLSSVADQLRLTYSPTTWQSGWTPSRNAARLNNMEQQAVVGRQALDTSPGTFYAQVYVSPSGNDSNPGTLSEPFLSLEKARDAVRLLSGSMTGHIAVNLRGGTYRRSSTFTLTSADSGQNGYQIIWRSYPGESAIIDGGVLVSGWTLHDAGKNIWRCPATVSSRHLYVNGVRCQRARGASNPSGYATTGTGYIAPDSSMAAWGNKSDIEIVSYTGWKMFRGSVASISGTAITMDQPYWANALLSAPYNVGLPAWIENAYELLDTAGEFYLDDPANVLYYIPRPGESLATATSVLSNIQTLVQVTGTEQVGFEDITFQHAGWNEPSSSDGYVGLQAGVHRKTASATLVKTPGAVSLSGVKNVSIADCTFQHLGAAGIDCDGGSQNVLISSSTFTDISSSGIQLGGIDDRLQTNAALQNGVLTVSNNLVEQCSVEYRDAAAIFAAIVRDTLITHNEVRDVPYTGVSLGWGWVAPSYAVNNTVSYNYIHGYLGGPTNDGGGVYTLSSQPGSLVTRNHIRGASNVFGALYPDEGSAYIEWSYNVCRSNYYQWLHIWTSTIHDLNVHDNWTDTSSYENNGTNITLTNNTLVTNENWPAGALTVIAEAGPQAGHP